MLGTVLAWAFAALCAAAIGAGLLLIGEWVAEQFDIDLED